MAMGVIKNPTTSVMYTYDKRKTIRKNLYDYMGDQIDLYDKLDNHTKRQLATLCFVRQIFFH